MEESMKPKTLLNKLIHVFDSSKDGLWYMGYDDRVKFYNSRFYEQFEMPVEDSTLDDWIKLIHPLDRDSFSKRVISHKEGNTTRVISEYRGCNGQLKLATVLEFSQYNRSDSLGVRPPLY
ncbi:MULTISPECIES: PAS domain-containing protein [Vibrio]|uniref:PAS domain-containing protein n=1 Tax=Vibrio TaxID=662 RepID=UPI00056F92C2|nr:MULTISPECIES: PAS domain-containing protein [Vibrio]EKO3375667.1 PAS domain-containing protein [Vibrio fluvialis]MBY7794225.1 PAS domain-containing protein [Vibrio fluvialis]MBY7801729.1 PAS domain-containing protein [Vibrio fluvialis]MBY7841023.1 PAS domain-containing protein [Vibrio fluvialis]MBY7893858.1 PAS domain-containing protein [Vibrio fluvialis]